MSKIKYANYDPKLSESIAWMEMMELDYIQIDFIKIRMKEYAEWYLEQFKENCKHHFFTCDCGKFMIPESHFDNIPNPPHE